MQLSKYTTIVEEEIAKINLPQSPADLYDPITYILGLGGKRIRPILTMLGASLFDENVDAKYQALSVELFHNFTLIHDDIMDEAPLRRGKETVHKRWNQNVGILSGDALLIIAYQQLIKTDPKYVQRLTELFNATALEVCEGQQMDMDFESRDDVSIAEYIEMIRLKTSVLLGCALQMGAIVAGANEKDQAELYNFGQKLGIAFQIQDDILDLYADPDKFGKQVGGDVIANKKTLIHLTAVSMATQGQMEMLKKLASIEDANQKISQAKEIYGHLEIKDKCQEVMKRYHDEALVHLNNVSVAESKKAELKALADYLMNRES